MQRAVLVEIFVAAVEETHEVLRRFGQLEQPLAHREGHEVVMHAVQDQDRRGDFSDPRVGAVLILHQ